MIYISRVVTVNKGLSLIDEQIVLFKGDKNVEVQFIVKNNPFKNKDTSATSHGQLIIDREAGPIFSEISQINNNRILFVITEDMINDLEEVGNYDFQIRLFDSDKTSRVTLPPVHAGIAIENPICEEAAVSSTYVNNRRAIIAADFSEEETFDEEGNYNATTWSNGDIITDTKLNKIENAIYTINSNAVLEVATKEYVNDVVAANNSALDDRYLKESDMSTYATKEDIVESIAELELDTYATQEFVNDAIASNNDELDDKYAYKTELDAYVTEANFENQVLEATRDVYLNEDNLNGYATEEYVGGALEPYATKEFVTDMIGNVEGGNVDLTDYATKEELQTALGDIDSILGGI